jgi:predicted metal-dependent peptidase
MASKAAEDALTQAKLLLMTSSSTAFYTSIMLSLKQIWDNNQPTAYTNGRVIGWNETFFLKLAMEERVGVLLHEILHVVLEHLFRKGDRDHQKFNRAADYAINLIIIAAGFKLPKWALYDIAYMDMSTEQIYDLIPDEPEPEWDENPQDIDGAPGDEALTPEETKALQADIDDMLIQAVTQSQLLGDKPGTIPGSVERYIESLLQPKLPWHRILKSYVMKLAKVRRTYRKPNRRYFPDHILPTKYSKKVCDPSVAVDCSCSVDDHQFKHFVCETESVLRTMKPDKLDFIQFDTRIISNDSVKSIADLKKLNFEGKGGTHIDPIMQWAADNKPPVLIVFTDGYFSPSKIDPKVPVVWIIYDNPNFKAAFGKVLHYEFDDE